MSKIIVHVHSLTSDVLVYNKIVWIDLNTCALLKLPHPLTWKIHIQCSSEPLLKVSRNILLPSVGTVGNVIGQALKWKTSLASVLTFYTSVFAFIDQSNFPDYQINIFFTSSNPLRVHIFFLLTWLLISKAVTWFRCKIYMIQDVQLKFII